MASAYAISATFSLIDKITNPLNRINQSGTRAADALKKSYMAAEKRVDVFGKKLKTALSYAPLALAGAGTAAVMAAGKQFIEFDDAVTKSGALFADTQNLKGDAFKSTPPYLAKHFRFVRVHARGELSAYGTGTMPVVYTLPPDTAILPPLLVTPSPLLRKVRACHFCFDAVFLVAGRALMTSVPMQDKPSLYPAMYKMPPDAANR